MTGTIRKRGQRSWGVRFDIGRDPATGKRRFRYLSVKGTKADARRALTEVLHEHDTGTDVARSRITVSEFLNRWLSDHAAMNAAPSTLTRYRQIVERLAPLVGALQLQELRPPHIQDAYARLLEDGSRPVVDSAGCWSYGLRPGHSGSRTFGERARIPDAYGRAGRARMN